ncbi:MULTISPECIES: hypothetical protein [unclassified Haladaptatus]|uniref:hypothetical protein n=1 Tax=unclassified Haladaptatus TaxID=2622732 RepID=UPI00209C0BC1|nr:MULTISPECIES: hypothetical protein [unclassified Haladaptatus]MCO8245741.1 hypothetical protein [Haladaptatus sp. AB643]MCO8256086.1 hypothetical protein [Haladaptatus sp. AB618]
MFETTFGVLQKSPLAIVPLVAIGWFVALGVRRSKLVSRVARYVFVLGVIPPFCLFVLADFFGSQSSRGLARTLLDSEVRLVVGMLDTADRLTAAVLRAFLHLVSGVTPGDPLVGITSMLPSWDPFAAISAVGFLVAVFALHFVAGIVVIRITRWENGASLADEWLSAAGVVLFVSGMVWMLLQFDPTGFGNFELRASVLASSMGLVTGITVSNLPVNLPAWWPDGVMGDGETADAESKADTPTGRERTRRASRSDTRSPRASATETATGDASAAESTSRTEAADSDPSFERLQKTVESLLRR